MRFHRREIPRPVVVFWSSGRDNASGGNEQWHKPLEVPRQRRAEHLHYAAREGGDRHFLHVPGCAPPFTPRAPSRGSSLFGIVEIAMARVSQALVDSLRPN